MPACSIAHIAEHGLLGRTVGGGAILVINISESLFPLSSRTDLCFLRILSAIKISSLELAYNTGDGAKIQ